jgi:hypothetical protein
MCLHGLFVGITLHEDEGARFVALAEGVEQAARLVGVDRCDQLECDRLELGFPLMVATML